MLNFDLRIAHYSSEFRLAEFRRYLLRRSGLTFRSPAWLHHESHDRRVEAGARREVNRVIASPTHLPLGEVRGHLKRDGGGRRGDGALGGDGAEDLR